MNTTTPDSMAVSALATAALMMHHPDKGRDIPDSRFPADIARDLVEIRMHGNGMDDASCFGIGFAMGLELGAMIATNPLGRPVITDLVTKYEELVRRTYIECEADYKAKPAA